MTRMTGSTGEIAAGRRFAFGSNWSRFLARVSEQRIRSAVDSLRAALGTDALNDVRFLDVGCGSGLFSLAARRMGARVHCFDYDGQCVTCAEELKRRFAPDDPLWTIEQGSALDREYLCRLGLFDVVYVWGVLHATGAMYAALENVLGVVVEGGQLHLAIYNDQGGWSVRWRHLKRIYNALPDLLKLPYTLLVMGPRETRLAMIALVQGQMGDYLRSWSAYERQRGMSRWHDMIDWLGGYPFEVAKPEEIFDFCHSRGFELEHLKTSGCSIACNEYVFRRKNRAPETTDTGR